jgi:hypothetical protein
MIFWWPGSFSLRRHKSIQSSSCFGTYRNRARTRCFGVRSKNGFPKAKAMVYGQRSLCCLTATIDDEHDCDKCRRTRTRLRQGFVGQAELEDD